MQIGNSQSGTEILAQMASRANRENAMSIALLNHYAAFVEAQTGKPAAETIAEVQKEAEAEFQDFNTQIAETLQRVLEQKKKD